MNENALIIVPDEKTAAKLQNTLAGFFDSVLIYPKKDFIFMNMESANNPFECERLKILEKVSNGHFGVVITTLDAALQFTVPREKLKDNTIDLKYGGNINNLEDFLAKLVAAGYKRTETVETVGRFSVRGGIIDIFSPDEDYPVRIELFGDEIDSMGFFDPASQRRVKNIQAFKIIPVSEIIIDEEARKRCVALLETLVKNKNADENMRNRLYFELDCLISGEELSSKARFISCVYEKSACLFDYFDNENTLLFINESAKVNERQKAAEQILNETIIDLAEKNYIDGKNACYSRTLEDFDILRLNFKSIIADMFLSGHSIGATGLFSFTARQSPRILDGFNILKDDLENLSSAGYKIAAFLNSDAGVKSLCDTLSDFNIKYIAAAIDKYKSIEEMPEGYITIIKTPRVKDLPCDIQGFELPKQKFALIAESSLDVRSENIKKRSASSYGGKSSRQKIMSYTDLTAGDYVVHSNYGIGIFMAIERLDVAGGVQKDFIKIKYAGSDVLYVPCNQLDLVSKYIGARSEDSTVRLSKMGSQTWQKAKSRAKSAAKDIARELIKLYAARQLKKGYAFLPDTEWQKDFESLFEYAETEDQLICAEQIKADMQMSVPMDRLLCGDVGFGKTEVALRAVFKCVSESKQAAILVPTTILAWQHYQTILSRFREFPVKIDMLSRFRNKKEQAETLRKLKAGDIDIIIGTHRIIQNDVKFKDLGLLVVDEEQRFGVAHKEKIKQMSESVDVLTLTATPIPRTLNMALSGIRDMSVIEEAPRNRIPVQTYIFEYDDNIIAEAIKNEIRRGGRVFYLHNRVETIEQTAYRLRESCNGRANSDTQTDEIKFAVAHGQMDEESLSSVWRSMINGDTDVLVCTTIIESGVDIPEANTLIVENADRLGLAQLHQIRGRVGRSNRRAYAYLTYPKNKVLSEIATKRLQAIREYTEFGAGFKIAMRDLEIRGAGNLLGSQQHGAMEGVGYDLYVRILERAVADQKKKLAQNEDYFLELALDLDDDDAGNETRTKTNAKSDLRRDTGINKLNDDTNALIDTLENEELELSECLIDIAVDAFIPQRYIDSEILRIEIYKRIAAIESLEDADDLTDELIDRFGDIPKAVNNLINIALIRNSACLEYIDTIENKHEGKDRAIVMYINALAKPQGQKLLEKWTVAAGRPELKGKLLLSLGQKPHAAYFLKPGEDIIDTLKLIMRILSDIKLEKL